MTSNAENMKNNLSENNDMTTYYEGITSAIFKSQAVIEFNLDGTILSANDNFLNALGYQLDEIVGQHHRIFVAETFAKSKEYKEFWKKLNCGEYEASEYKRITKAGNDIWIQASYNPIMDKDGKPFKVVKFATDITKQKLENAEYAGKVAAIGKSQAVIEFNMDGTIIVANENFLNVVGYDLAEIVGKHHRMFVQSDFANQPEYKQFWEKLNRGEYEANEYKRIGNAGKEVWIQASYNPIMDMNGRPFKVVKFATDITEQKLKRSESSAKLTAIDKSQASIEFNMDGTIITANKNFLNVVGYDLAEIVGKHHRMFVQSDFVNQPEYKQFWEKLNRGEYEAKEYKRIGKGGKEVWINASYNPIFDLNEKPFKVVKYAADLTKEKVAYNSLVASFDKASDELGNASGELSDTATLMVTNANSTSGQSTSAAAASEEISQGIRTLSVNTEEMTATIKEISKSSTQASEMSRKATTDADQTSTIIANLGDASQEIGQVIKTISAIAQQTNLLALNATIEAARAGDAGKGFAVVANEVKELAKQTAVATDDITKKIENIQNSTRLATVSVSEINSVIKSLNEIAISTASAVEEQAATTNEVSRVIGESNEGLTSIVQSIQGVSKGAEESSTSATQTLEAAKQLSNLANNLKQMVLEAK